MSHTISARKADGFKVEVFNWDNKLCYSATYADRVEAQNAAEYYERLVTLANGQPVLSMDEIMSDDELLAELGL